MQIKRKKIEKNLQKKGFEKIERKGHTYLHHVYQGKYSGIKTYLSRGSGYKDYGDDLINMMKKELFLDSIKQAADLFNCPMDESQYNSILINKGKI